jgi:penicillin amidase
MEISRKKRILWGLAIFVLIIFTGIMITGYLLIMRSQPQVKGEIRLRGISSEIRIIRDSYGVPHIFAANEEDLMFAAGFVQAQDRLWQMDLLRRVSEGRLSEIFGSVTLQADKSLRSIGFTRVAQAITDSMDASTRNLLQRYADGVNAFIRENRDNYPIEFVLLDFSPKDWRVEHSVAVSRVMAWQLSMGWYVDVAYDKILDSVSYQKLQDIFPRYPENAPVVVKEHPPGYRTDTNKTAIKSFGQTEFTRRTTGAGNLLNDFVSSNLMVKEIIGNRGFAIGSNNWVVSGSKSESGKPLLANDPHLGHGVPSTWYEMQLSGGGWDVTGFALPGSPFIVIGNNRAIAWGVTAVMTDDADFYKERINDTAYYLDGQWTKLKWIREEIAIKDSLPVIFDIPFTHRGPIVNSMYDLAQGQTTAVSARWLGHEPSGEVTAFRKLNQAKNWEDFRSALRSFKVPGLNVVYADVEGHIGYQCMSGIPIRKSGNGISVLDGTNSQNDWSGEVPFESLPFSYDPPENYLASANNKIVGEWFPFFVTNYWEHPSRIERIDQFLQSKNKFSIHDFKNLQNDLYSFHAAEVVPFILEACAKDSFFSYLSVKEAPNYPYHESYLFLKHWDLNMNTDSRGAAIFNVFFQHLLNHLYKDEMGETIFESFIKLSNIPARITTQLLNNRSSSWWDNIRTVETEDRDQIIRFALKDAVDFLKERLGKEPGGWTWGKLHSVTFEHPIGKQKPLNYLFNVGPYKIGGNTTTVNNTEYHYSDTQFRVLLGPSMRRLIDMNDPAHPLTVLTLGQSGQPYNEHYLDQTHLWLEGLYKTFSMNENELKKAGATLFLKPKTE